MATVQQQIRLGPADHGRPISDWDFDSAELTSGFRYELIEGRVYVSSEPDPQENGLESWLEDALKAFARSRPDVVNYVTNKARVYAPGRRVTIPEPDLACYCGFPRDRQLIDLQWHEVSPILVAEVLVAGDPEKDLKRNVDLYLRVTTIKEYWVLDDRVRADQPSLIQHRRRGARWIVRTYPYSSTFTTKLLPGFELLIDPRK
jgi:Uma2 family endonuclease